MALLAPGTLEENAEGTDQLKFPLKPLYGLKNVFPTFLLNLLEWTFAGWLETSNSAFVLFASLEVESGSQTRECTS